MKFALVFLYKMSVMSAIYIGFPIESEPSAKFVLVFLYKMTPNQSNLHWKSNANSKV